jgi:hypothetical protein
MCTTSFHESTSPSCATKIIFTVLLISIGLSATEESILISQSSAAPPPESVEARIKLRQHREASALNRFTFAGNVLDSIGDIVDHWFVMFCPGWHEKCQSLLPSYELLGVQWEDKLNTGLMSSTVRFAKVDCATEKALCVSLGIDDYSSVVHYRQQQHVNAWFGGAPGLVRWIKEELQPPKRRASTKPRPGAPTSSKLEEALEKTSDQAVKQSREQTTCNAESAATTTDTGGRLLQNILRPLSFLLILAIVTCYCFSIYRAALRRRQESSLDGKGTINTPEGCSQERQHAAASAQSIML